MPTAVSKSEMNTPAHPAKKVVTGAGGKVLGEPYKSTGNEAADTLAFLHVLGQLKTEKRSGWIREGVDKPESISDHMCRMALMAMMIPSTAERPLDIPRCVMMALVHDLAEAYVGDITPLEGVPSHVKHELEEKAMNSFLDEMLGGESNTQARERFRALWYEYEARETPEAKLVKDIDRLELIVQAVEYEKSQDIRTLKTFYTGTIPHLEHPAIRKMAESVIAERQALWKERGADDLVAELEAAKVGEAVDAREAAAVAAAGSNKPDA